MESERPGGVWEGNTFRYFYPAIMDAEYVAPFEARCDMWPYDYKFELKLPTVDVPEYAWRMWRPMDVYIDSRDLFDGDYYGRTTCRIRLGRGFFTNEYYVMSRLLYVSPKTSRVYFAHITLLKFFSETTPRHLFELPHSKLEHIRKAEDIMAEAVRKKKMQRAIVDHTYQGGDFEDDLHITRHFKQLHIHQASDLHEECHSARRWLQDALPHRPVPRHFFHVSFDAVAEPYRSPDATMDIIGLQRLRPHELKLQLGVLMQHPEHEEYLWRGALTHEPLIEDLDDDEVQPSPPQKD